MKQLKRSLAYILFVLCVVLSPWSFLGFLGALWLFVSTLDEEDDEHWSEDEKCYFKDLEKRKRMVEQDEKDDLRD